MRKVHFIVLCVITLLMTVPATAQEKLSKVKVHLNAARDEAGRLLGLLETDHFAEGPDGSLILNLNDVELQVLKHSGYPYQVLVPDVARHLDSLNAIYFNSLQNGHQQAKSRTALRQPGSALDNIIVRPNAFEVKSKFGGYYSFAEMEAAMNNLVASFPQIAQKISIGKTHNNRDIWLIKISDNVATDEAAEPEVLYLGLQHAREAITGASMIFFMQYLCEQYYVDNRIKDLVNNREFFIIPCFNPDGWEYNRTTATGTVDKAGGGWRKNRSPQGADFGVDLNRNWGVDWANCSNLIDPTTAASCGSNSTSSSTYWGPSAFSENETQAVRNFVKEHHITAAFDQHAYGPYYSLPFGRQALHTMSEKGKNFFTAIPALMGAYNGMRAADSYDALGYEVAGGFKDWMLIGELGSGIATGLKDTVWAMTGEGGAGGGTAATSMSGMGDFWAPASEIVNLCKGMCYQNLQLAYAAGTYVDIEDNNDIAITATSGSLKFRAKRLGIGNNSVQVSLVALENIQVTGAPVTISSMQYYEDVIGSISYKLPVGLSNGQKIKYIWRVQTSGYSYADTIVRIYNPQVLLNDDMEGSIATNWTVSSGWALTNKTAFGGTKSMTESPTGNYAAGANHTVTYNDVIDLSNSKAAYLTFWTRHRAENFRDKLQVQVTTSTRNNATWTTIPGKTTIKEPGTLDGSTINGVPSLTGIQDYWVQEVFDLTGYTSSSFRFRFAFAADNSNTTFKYEQDDGFYIDNVKLVKTTSDLTVLPVTFISFTGKALPDKTVQLHWEAIADAMHDYYEVERSTDGVNFSKLGKGENMFLDKEPVIGVNYYRLKQWDKDGRSSYSTVVGINIKSDEIEAALYPNPAYGMLNIKFQEGFDQTVNLQVFDANGRLMMHNRISPVTNTYQLNVQSWPAQIYNLKITDDNGNILLLRKFSKL